MSCEQLKNSGIKNDCWYYCWYRHNIEMSNPYKSRHSGFTLLPAVPTKHSSKEKSQSLIQWLAFFCAKFGRWLYDS